MRWLQLFDLVPSAELRSGGPFSETLTTVLRSVRGHDVRLVRTRAAGLVAVRLAGTHGTAAPFLVTAAALAAFALVAAVMMRDAPRRPRPEAGAGQRMSAAFRLPITWQASLWFAIVLALFVTFSSYLPTYLTNAYRMSSGRTGDLLAAFVLVAVLMRPVGGWLADRFSPARPLTVALVVVAAATAVQAATPPLPVVVGVTLPVLAVALGVCSGSTLALVAQVALDHGVQ